MGAGGLNLVLHLASGATVLGAEMAEAEGGGGFGFNLDLIETNVINLAIVIGVLVYFLRGFLSKALSDRSSAIEVALTEAERRRQETANALAAEQEKLKQAQAEAAQILVQAQADAQNAREAILAKAADDVAKMKQAAAADLSAEEMRIMGQLRQRIAELAMQQAEQQLSGRLDVSAQQRLVDRSITLLGGQ
jgi:F-type H+-transporting ATPase subunit b